jgi:hypothetical protein
VQPQSSLVESIVVTSVAELQVLQLGVTNTLPTPVAQVSQIAASARVHKRHSKLPAPETAVQAAQVLVPSAAGTVVL